MDQRPVQVGKTTACSVATSVDSVKDPTPKSFQGIDLADKEIHNQVEGKIDSRVDLKAVDTGLGAHICLEAHTDTGVVEVVDKCTQDTVDTGKLVVEQHDHIEVGTVPGTEVEQIEVEK